VEDTYYIKNQKVWDATVRRVDQMRKEHYAKSKADGLQPFEKMGAEDGLAGAYPQKGKAWDSKGDYFRPEEAVDAYDKGWKQGEARRKDALKRAKARGERDGMEGKPINLEQLWSFAEIDELRRRDLQRRGDGFSFTEAYEPFVESYKKGHRGGQKTGTERTLRSVEIFEGKSLTAIQYTSRLLHVVAKYSAGPDAEVTRDVTWSSSDPNKVEIIIQGQSVHAMMKASGKATVTAKYQGDGVALEAAVVITVEPAQIEIGLSASTMSVGDALPIFAMIKGRGPLSRLPQGETRWTITPPGIASITTAPPDGVFVSPTQDMVLTALKPGKANITVTNADKSVKATAAVTVVAKKK
jgi:hypothetical protein